MLKFFCTGFMLLTVLAAASSTVAQTSSSQSQGSQRRNSMQPCANVEIGGIPATQAQSDAPCTPLGPNFAVPSTNQPKPSRSQVLAVIRVNTVVPRPEKFPYPMDFETVGDATMLKTHLPELRACLGVARSWTRRTNASTSATCIDRKGEVLAYQECNPGESPDAPACTVKNPGPEDVTTASR